MVGAVSFFMGLFVCPLVYKLSENNWLRGYYEKINVESINHRRIVSYIAFILLMIAIRGKYYESIIYDYGFLSFLSLLLLSIHFLGFLTFGVANELYEKSKGPPRYKDREHVLWILGFKLIGLGGVIYLSTYGNYIRF